MTSPAKQVDIVVLDDDVDLLSSVAVVLAQRLRLSREGVCRCRLCNRIRHGQSFALGLFDYRLGSLKNGLDVVEKMQALGCKSTYVMITADVEQATQMRAVHLKLYEFMRKPVKFRRSCWTRCGAHWITPTRKRRNARSRES